MCKIYMARKVSLIVIKRPVRDAYLFSPKFDCLFSPKVFKTIGAGKFFGILCADLKLYFR